MEQIILIRKNGGEVKLNSTSPIRFINSAGQQSELMSVDTVKLVVTSSELIEFGIGDKILINKDEYFVLNACTREFVSENHFIYEITFYGVIYELINSQYRDTDIQGNSSKSSFDLTYELKDFIKVLIYNVNRDYPGRWEFDYTNCPDTEPRTYTFSKQNCLEVLQNTCKDFGYDFSIRQNNGIRTIKIGLFGNVVTPPGGNTHFEYGKGSGLYRLKEKNVDDVGVITRLWIEGGTQNIRSDYRGYSDRLQLPLRRKNKYSHILDNGTFISADSEYIGITDENNRCIEDAALAALIGPNNHTNHYDNIYPQRTGTVTALGDDIYSFVDEMMNFDLSEADSEGNTIYLINGVPAKINFITGKLVGQPFNLSDYDPETKTFKIIKYTDDRGMSFPSESSTSFRIEVGDKYRITDINLPQSYIDDAEEDLWYAGYNDFLKLKQVRVSYDLTFDPLYFKNALPTDSEAVIFRPGDYVPIKDERFGIDKNIRIQSVKRDLLKEHDYSLTLSDSTSINIIDKTIKDVHDHSIILERNKLRDSKKLFLSKISPDSAKEVITFLKGIIAAGVSEFADMLVSGKITAENIDVNNHLLTSTLQVVVAATLNDVILKGQLNSEAFNSGFLGNGFRLARINDRWTLELDDIIVRKTMYIYELVVQRIRYQGGQVIHSPAGGKITSVTNGGSYWRVEHDSPESFTTGAQVLCQNFKVGSETQNPDGSTTFQGVSVKRYWRLVTSFGKGWFNFSKTDMEAGSAEPEVGDDIAVLGHRTDPDQQNAIMIVSAGSGSPYIAHYAGINSYSTEGKEVVREGNLSGIVDPDFGQLSGFGLYSNNVYLKGIFRLMNGQTITEFVEDSINLSVSSKVDKDKILASINLSEEGIKIDAEKIEFTGSVSFQSAAKDAVRDDIDEAVEKATFWAIKTSSPVIYKDAPNAETSGAHTTIIAAGELRSGTTSTPGGFITVTPDGGTEGTATPSPVILSPSDGDGKTGYTIKLYDKVDKSVLLDTVTIPVIFKGDSAKTLRVERFTTPGWDMYRDGVPYSATLAVRVFYDDIDETDTINIARFVWIRISENEPGDTVWNELHVHSGASVDITNADLAGDTSFIVQFWDASKINLLQTTKF